MQVHLQSSHFQRVPWSGRCAVKARVDYHGNDLQCLTGVTMEGVIHEGSCCDSCQADHRCKAWTYSPSLGKCWLKNATALTSATRPNLDRMSGMVCAKGCSRTCRQRYWWWFLVAAAMGCGLALLLIGASIHDANVALSDRADTRRGAVRDTEGRARKRRWLTLMTLADHSLVGEDVWSGNAILVVVLLAWFALGTYWRFVTCLDCSGCPDYYEFKLYLILLWVGGLLTWLLFLAKYLMNKQAAQKAAEAGRGAKYISFPIETKVHGDPRRVRGYHPGASRGGFAGVSAAQPVYPRAGYGV